MLAVIDQIFVGLVGNDDQIALDGEGGNFLGLGAREDQAAGILRRVVVDGARLCGVENWASVLRMPLRRAVLVGTAAASPALL
jgi:hypothetical protein